MIVLFTVVHCLQHPETLLSIVEQHDNSGYQVYCTRTGSILIHCIIPVVGRGILTINKIYKEQNFEAEPFGKPDINKGKKSQDSACLDCLCSRV